MTELTQQSFLTPPFDQSVGKDWTDTPGHTKLMKIFTELDLTQKNREQDVHDVDKKRLDNILQLFSDENLGKSTPVRILVTGQC